MNLFIVWFSCIYKIAFYPLPRGKCIGEKVSLVNPCRDNSMLCDCGMFIKNGVCMHLVGFSWLFEKYFYESYKNYPTPNIFIY